MLVNKDELVKVRNLCDWNLYFKLQNVIGDVNIPANGSKNMFVSEIISQIDNGNVFFVGNDGKGSHAKIYIEHEDLRKQLAFDRPEDKETQKILTDEKCDYILNLKTQSAFEKNIKDFVVMNHEKDKIMKYAKKINLNDYQKINFLKKYCNSEFSE